MTNIFKNIKHMKLLFKKLLSEIQNFTIIRSQRPLAHGDSSVKLSYYYNTTQILIGSLPTIENNENLHFQMSLFSNWDSVENSIFNISLHELSLIPEFFLALTAVILITHCSLIAYNKRYNSILLQFSVTSLCILILFLTFLLYFHEAYVAVKYLSFEFSFLSDSLGFLSKIITVTASLVCMYLLQDYIIEYKINSTEYDLLMLYAILGLTMLITANDFGTIFLALELQSLSLYMLSGSKKTSIYPIESGLKYFILGALSASYFLLGWSLLYGISGLFVLLGFFLFNIFSDVSTKETNYTRYVTQDENKSENELTIISVVTPLSDLFFENSKGEEINRVLIPFSNSFTVLVKLTKLFCCDCSITRQDLLEQFAKRRVGEDIILPTSFCGKKSTYTNSEAAEMLAGGLLLIEQLMRKNGPESWPLLLGYQISLKKLFYSAGFRPDPSNPFHNPLTLSVGELGVPMLGTKECLKLATEFRRQSDVEGMKFSSILTTKNHAWKGLALLTEDMVHNFKDYNNPSYVHYFWEVLDPRRQERYLELRFYRNFIAALREVPGAADPERLRAERGRLLARCCDVLLFVSFLFFRFRLLGWPSYMYIFCREAACSNDYVKTL